MRLKDGCDSLPRDAEIGLVSSAHLLETVAVVVAAAAEAAAVVVAAAVMSNVKSYYISLSAPLEDLASWQNQKQHVAASHFSGCYPIHKTQKDE